MARKVRDAAWYEYVEYGDAEVLHRVAGPLDDPGPGDVTVEVMTTAINHMDAFLRNGKEQTWSDLPWPRRSGSDFAGVVTATGPGVTSFKVGSEVIGHTRTGAHATHITVPAWALVAKPRNIEWEVAGSLYLAGATALDILDELRIGAGDVLVVSAAAGGVGSLQVQLAKQLGARVIGTCGERNFDYLRQIGVTPVKYGDDMVERIRRAAGGPVTAFIDNFGKDGSDIAEALGVPESKYRSSEYRREVELRLLQDDPASIAHGTAQLTKLTALLGQGAFRMLVSGLYPLDDIIDAFEDLARLHSRGKIVLATRPVTTYRTLKARDVQDRISDQQDEVRRAMTGPVPVAAQ